MTDTTKLKPQIDETSFGYMLRLSAPMIIASISFTVMQFVDRFMVSRLGTPALAAILPASIISFIPASFALGVMTSVNTFVSQSFGRKQYENCSSYCWQVLYMGLIYSIFTFAILWPAAPWIFKTMGFEPAIVEMEVAYFRIMLYTQFIVIFIWSGNQFFMGIHRPVITMYATIIGQAVNIASNYVLIFGKFGFPQMGIAGAAWGTFIGTSVGAVIRTVVFLNGDINATFKSRHTNKIDFSKMRDLIKIGFPAGFGFMINVTCLGTILFGLVSRFGSGASAATSAVFTCMNVSFMPVVGIGTALTAAVGKSIGKGQKEMAIKQTAICLKISLIYMGLIGLCFFLFREKIITFWSPTNDPAVIEVGVRIFIFAAIFQVFDAASITYSGALRGAGDTVWIAVVAGVGSVMVLGLGGLALVKYCPQLRELGPWIALTAYVICAAIAHRWRFKTNSWMRIDLFKRRPAAMPTEIEPIIE